MKWMDQIQFLSLGYVHLMRPDGGPDLWRPSETHSFIGYIRNLVEVQYLKPRQKLGS